MILTIALVLSAQVEQYPWVQVSRDQQQTHFVDILSVRVDGERRFLRHRVDYATVQPNGAVTAEYEVAISCEARAIALLEGTEWDEAAAIVQSHTYEQPTPRPIDPSSLAETLFELVCDPGTRSSPISPETGLNPPWRP